MVPLWQVIVGGLVGGAVTAALTLWWARRHREPWPELEELVDANTRLTHRVKMLQGRLNQIAPPREGTGLEGIVPEPTQALPAAIRRANLLRDWQARNRNKGA